MNLVTLEGVGKQYSERVLLEGVDLRIESGERIGLIGVNGSGKTTLLRLVADLATPDAGSVTVWGNVRVTYLPQEPVLDPEHTVLEAVYHGEAPILRRLRDHAAAVRALDAAPDDGATQQRLHATVAALDAEGGWNAEAEAKAVLTRLGITDMDTRVATLSGGQHKRVALARALIDPADLLVLDEPTNHIDADTVAWLEAFLVRGNRSLLMVTHDRYFLDRVANRIVELDRRALVSYPGNYGHYIEKRAQRHERLTKSEEVRRRHLARELEWLRRGAKARSTKQKARKQRIDELQTLRYDRREDRVAFALASRRLGKRALEADHLSKAYGDQTVLDDVSLHLGPGDRIGILGPNGAGKSTLLDILAGRTEPDSGTVSWGDTVKLGYFDQRSAELRDDLRLIDYIDQEAPLIQTPDGGRVTSALMLEWLLFSRKQQQAYIGSLSGGERRRLYLLRTLIHQPNVLLLDEPTNDVDIETLGVLEDFLDRFTGTLIVVSHDRYFLDRTVDQLAVVQGGRLHAGYPVPFESYLRIRGEQRANGTGPDAENAAGSANSASGIRDSSAGPDQPGESNATSTSHATATADATQRGTVRPRKLSFKEARELEAVTASIATQEARKAELEAAINGAGADFARMSALADELAALEEQLDDATMRWLELSEIAEGGG